MDGFFIRLSCFRIPIILLFMYGFQFGVIIRDKNGYKMHFRGHEPEEIN